MAPLQWIHAKGKPTAATGPLLLGNTTPTILRKKIEEDRIVGAFPCLHVACDGFTGGGADRGTPASLSTTPPEPAHLPPEYRRPEKRRHYQLLSAASPCR